MTPDQILTIIGSSGGAGGIVLWLLRRHVERSDKMEGRIATIEVKMAGELATKDDVTNVTLRLDRVDDVLTQVRLSLARLEERSKGHDKE